MAERKKKSDDAGLVSKGWDTTKDKISQAKDKTKDFVEENPWKSAAIAAVVGAATALGAAALFGRRKKSWWNSFRDMFG